MLDKFLEDDLSDGLNQFYLQIGTADKQKVKMMHFFEMEEDMLKSLTKDKADITVISSMSSLSSSSCSPP